MYGTCFRADVMSVLAVGRLIAAAGENHKPTTFLHR
jgi:hypothetical protein